ncbi:MAG: hypothetical protein ACTSVI_01585 [Promethearchaeota archaeon]
MALLNYFIKIQWLAFILLFPLSIAIHFLIDAIAKATYHPPKALTGDKFWITWHLIIYAGSVFVAIYFWNPYAWGMFASILPDIYDWGIIRVVRHYNKKRQEKDPSRVEREKEFMEGKEFHPWVEKFRDKFLARLPNLNLQRKGIIPEILIWIGCIAITVLIL